MRYKTKVEAHLEQLITLNTRLKNGLLDNNLTQANVLTVVNNIEVVLGKLENLLELEADES